MNPLLLQDCCSSNSLISNKDDTLAPSALCICPSTSSNSEERGVLSLVLLVIISIISLKYKNKQLFPLYLERPIYHPLSSSPSEKELLFNVDFWLLINSVMYVELGVTMSDRYC